MSVKTAVALEEYLQTSYEYAPEYVDGELVERSLPTVQHGVIEHRIATAFWNSIRSTRLYSAGQVRLSVCPTRYRIPDISIFVGSLPKEKYPSQPPFAVIEILSPDDAHGDLLEKFTDYETYGVQWIWLVDPDHSLISRYEKGNFLRFDAIEFPEHGFKLTNSELFAS